MMHDLTEAEEMEIWVSLRLRADLEEARPNKKLAEWLRQLAIKVYPKGKEYT